ncbi:MAG: NEW3 domain-containing protein [Bacteroidota bacterium]
MRLIGMLLIACLSQGVAFSTGAGEGIPGENAHPKAFIRNAGQWPADVQFGLLGAGAKAAMTRTGIDFFSFSTALQITPELGMDQAKSNESILSHTRVRFAQPSPRMRIIEGEEAVTRMHFYHGREATGWFENVGTVQSLLYENVWENIDLEYRFDGRHLRQSIHIRPGGNPEDIAFVVDGADAPDAVLRPYPQPSGAAPGLPMEIRVDTLRPRPGPDLQSWRQLVETEFCTFFGGKGKEQTCGIVVDGQSNSYVFMLTSSGDLPLRNEIPAAIRGGNGRYLAGLSCDGNTLIFGTYFGEAVQIHPTQALYYGSLYRARNDDLILLLYSNSNGFPITASAVQKEKSNEAGTSGFGAPNDVVMRFTNTGRLRASSFFFGPTFSNIIDVATGPDDDVYLLGHSTGEVWFITPGVVHPNVQVKDDCGGCVTTNWVARLSPELDALRWGTYLLNSNGNNSVRLWPPPNDTIRHSGFMPWPEMAIDSRGCPVIVGTTDTLSRLPATVQYGNPTYPAESAWIVCLSSNAKSYRYASSLHAQGSIGAFTLVLDANDNAYVAGGGAVAGFPYSSPPLLANAGASDRDGFIAKFDSSGTLLNAVQVGGNLNFSGAWGTNIALSRCAEIVLEYELGWLANNQVVNERDLARAERMKNMGLAFTTYLICDSALTNVSFAAPGHPNSADDGFFGGGVNDWGSDRLQFDPAGYMYRLNGYWGGSARMPLPYNTSRVSETESDVMISRQHYPICQLVNCSIAVRDTIVVPNKPEELVPSEFPITVTLSTDGALADASQVIGDLFLPAGINTLSGDSVVHLIFEPNTMHPGTQISRTVDVRATRPFQTDTIPYIFIGYYTDSRDERPCPRPLTVCNASTFLRRLAEYRPLPECELVVHDSLIDYPASPRCAFGTVPVQLTLRHRGLAPWEIGKVVLRLPDGMGLSFVLPGDSLRGDRLLYPGDTLSWTWMVNLPRLRYATLARIEVHVFESTGRELTHCWDEAPLPEMPGLTCALALPRTITWDAAQHRSLTDPIPVILTLDNRQDSSYGRVTARIDLSKASHLQLDAAETVVKQYGELARCATLDIQWILHATEPQLAFSSDTVIVFYSTGGNGTEYSCENRLQIILLDKSIACAVSLPDTLSFMKDDPTRMDTLHVLAEVRNTGTSTATLRDAILTISGAGAFTAVDPLRRDLTTLGQGASIQFDWRILLPASRFARSVQAELTVHDQRGDIMALCEARTWVTPLPSALQCAMEIPDSIRVDAATGNYSPGTFAAKVTVYNLSDSVFNGAAALIDLGNAPRLKLQSGESPTRALPPLPARDSVQLSWMLEVASPSTIDTLQDISVLITTTPATETWYCAKSLFLEGIVPVANLRCISFGHDSAYLDGRYEKIVPDPLQIGYSIFNDGNTAANACEVHLLLPAGWKFADGVVDPIAFGDIAAGDTVTHTWLITPDTNFQWADELSINFLPTCSGDTVHGACTHRIGFAAPGVWDIVVTPIRMVFRAERDGPLPSPQTASIWTANALPLNWTATPQASWLDVQPNSANGPGQIIVQPNTTQLSPSVYQTPIVLESNWHLPRNILVVYEVNEKTSSVAGPPQAPEALTVFPNPYSAGSGSQLHVIVPEEFRSSSDELQLSIHDLLGRELRQMNVEKNRLPGEMTVVDLAIPSERSCVVVVSLRSSMRTLSKLVLLTP